MNVAAIFKRWKPVRSGSPVLLLQTAALFLVILGVRFAIVWRFGSDLPYWDQWGVEGQELIKRYYDGTLSFRHWFMASNEHRVFFTRVIALGLTLLNGQWDARVEMLVNAVICTVAASGLFYFVAAGLKSFAQRWAWFVAVMVMFALPFGWENTIAGYQSQFYLLALFSLAAIALLGNYPAYSRQWLSGCLLLFCSLFSMASGLLAAIVIILLLVLLLIRERKNWRDLLRQGIPTYLFCMAIAIAGLMLTVRVEAHAQYRSQAVGPFLKALTACLAWPYIGHNWWVAVSWLPFVCLLIAVVAGFAASSAAERMALGMGLWVIVQSAATAFSRSTIVYSARYFDVYSYGLLANFLCLLLLGQVSRSAWKYAVLMPLAIVWLAVNGTHLYALSFNDALENRKFFYDVEAANTGAYLASNDFNFLVPKQDKKEIPFPNPETYRDWLKDPVIRAVLPGSVRPAIALESTRAGLNPGRNTLGILEMPINPGQRVWTAFQSPQGTSFEAVGQKSAALPFVSFFVNGDFAKIVIKDAHNRAHSLHKLPAGGYSGNLGQWQAVYAFCPGTECRISGALAGGAASLTFSEPREMGRWSVWGLRAASMGETIFRIGLAISVMALLGELFLPGIKRNK
jgi:hypothetical protein